MKVEELVEGIAVSAGDKEGRVRVGEAVVRVRGVFPGDRVRLRMDHVGKNATWGTLEEVLEPSPDRVPSPCPLVATCGGCPWMGWSYPVQLKEKQRRLAEILVEVPGAGPAPVVPCPQELGYRGKLQVVVSGRPGRLHLGLYATRSHEVVDARGCPVHHPEGDRVLDQIRRILDSHRVLPWEESTDQGVLRHLLIRVMPGTEEVGVVLVYGRVPRKLRRLTLAIRGIEGVASVYGVLNRGPGQITAGSRLHLAGAERLRGRVGEVDYLLSPAGFFQTNTAAVSALVDEVCRDLPERIGHLVDLYSGVGLFSLALAPRCDRVTAVERDPEAAGDLRAAGGVEVVVGDASSLQELAADVVIVDPPRSGLGPEVVAQLLAARPERLVYVSCGPAALARDLAVLVEGGMEVLSVVPVDLFPHTPHVETVVHLRG